MARDNYNDLQAFLAVARERSFTRAAAQLGVTTSALSHTIRALEARLGLRLLTRTTRSVATTQAGEQLANALGPGFADIDAALSSLSALRDRPSGTLRITSSEYPARAVLWPALRDLLPRYPDIHVEVVTDSALTDIVAERFDAGIRLGEQIAKDMIAVPIGPPERMAVVGAPAYFAQPSWTARATGPHRARLHQPAVPHPWRLVCVGVRKERPRGQRAGRGPAGLQQQ
ncbi:Transcriptional regulator [Lysobacter silvestris]|uniref:Transcriptional regulator n=1 Tax=Solilutibacter silvestris TaxID=1645665 RepID=A0A2K1Q209_9GAMM|nr:Transcriptional regulator [Lysobacter silvestris]